MFFFFMNTIFAGGLIYKKPFHFDKVLNTGSLQDVFCSTCSLLNKLECKGFQEDPFCCCFWLSNMGSGFNGLLFNWFAASGARPEPMALLAFCLSCSLASSKL